MMLLAARALTFMADVLPPSCGAIVRHGAVSAFCQRLLTIEYIDLAEQSLMVSVGCVWGPVQVLCVCAHLCITAGLIQYRGILF